ncbi:MAG: hypothetical protein D5R97_00585, partial [Candidatus Syntrophonatronum acetioxidans]
LSWDIDVPILTNKYIFNQVFIGVILAVVFAVTIILLIQIFSGDFTWDFLVFILQIFLSMVVLFMVMIALGVIIFMGNRYDYNFSLDPDKGIWEKPQKRQQKRNSLVNTLLIFLGILSKNPSASGAGVIAQSRQKQFVRWKDVNKIEKDPRDRVIILKRNSRTLMIIFCLPENYEEVLNIIERKVQVEEPVA